MSESVTVFEVGPRDGLQNEARKLALRDKLWFISGLAKAGLKEIEVGAFVREDRIPQMADTAEINVLIREGALQLGKARPWNLVPNRKGMELAIAAGACNIAVFTAATDSFAKNNIGMSVDESLREFESVLALARQDGMGVRGYVSTAFGCPFEGKVTPSKALKVIARLAGLGVDQISVGDTIGVASPAQVEAVIRPALRDFGVKGIAVHFHDTRGTALANTLRSLDLGVRSIDSSAGGLGGCPFAPSATGNLATEDLVYMLNGLGMRTGIDLKRLCDVSLELSRRMKRPLSSKYLQAYAAGKSGRRKSR